MRTLAVLSLAVVPLFLLLPYPASGQVVPLNPLQDAYWRFEHGTPGAAVATPGPDGQNPDEVLDSIHSNHMRTWASFSAPVYTSDVPVAIIPQTGAPNTVAMLFAPNQDIYTAGKQINNPVTTAFTLEAAFKPEVLNQWQGIVCKDGRPTADPETTLVLKIRAGASTDPLLNKLQIELFDRGGTRRSIESLVPLEAGKWYYAAVVATETQLALYLDRNDGAGYVLQGTAPVSGGGPLWQGGENPAGDDRAWCIGRGMHNDSPTDWFSGVIDEVRLTSRALTPAEFLFTDAGIPGDFDRDGVVDFKDFSVFTSCTTGPAISYRGGLPPGCTLTPHPTTGFLPADLDEDDDVDQDDFGIFQRNYGG